MLDKMWQERWNSVPTDEIRTAMQKLYELYDAEGLVRFFASLWNGERGAFYYSHSARDYEGYDVDAESTYQILNIMRNMGATAGIEGNDLRVMLGEEMSSKIIDFLKQMQDEGDEYFYNRQWRDSSSVMRVHRDLTQVIKLFEWLADKPLYKTPLERLSADNKSNAVYPEHITDLDTMREYVKDFTHAHTTEGWSNHLGSQTEMWTASGLIQSVLDILDGMQDAESGMWVVRKNEDSTYLAHDGRCESEYGILTSSYKIAAIYNKSNRRINHPIKIVENAIHAVMSEKIPETIPYLFNPWATLNYLRANIVKHSPELLSEYDRLIAECGPKMIYNVAQKLGAFRKPDCSYSYYPDRSHPNIYRTPSSLGIYEGDVNGTLLAIKSISDAVAIAFGCGSPIPLFNYKHAKMFVDACRAQTPPVKKPVPENK